MRPDALSFAAVRAFGTGLVERLSPRQRQYALLAGLMAAGIGLLWLVFALTAAPAPPASRPGTTTSRARAPTPSTRATGKAASYAPGR